MRLYLLLQPTAFSEINLKYLQDQIGFFVSTVIILYEKLIEGAFGEKDKLKKFSVISFISRQR